MGDANKGTDNLENINDNDSSWYILEEAECVDTLDSIEELFDASTGSDISNLIDEVDETDDGKSLALYNAQVNEECEQAIAKLKRKYLKTPDQSPESASVAALSPRLEAVTLSSRKQNQSKRRLFDDSGILEDEAANTNEKVDEVNPSGSENGAKNNVSLLQLSNWRANAFSKISNLFGVSFHELTRAFKNNKTCSANWVIGISRAAEELIESCKILLQQHCNFFQIITLDFTSIILVEFKSSKCRETVNKLFSTLLNIDENMIISEPPKIRSVPVALFFYKASFGNASYVFGRFPDWVARQTMINHQIAGAADQFDFSKMTQWAFDNNIVEDSEIAYKYALAADTDSNAQAFLRCNNQLRYVKDCSHMVKLYKRQQMKEMTMADWIYKCCDETDGEGNWKPIAQFLRLQEVNFLSFLITLKTFFKCIAKKQCIVFYGPPNTGKSMFSFSFVKFLKGRVVSCMNRNSQFWLSPLSEAKIGIIDDVTFPAWQYMDINMRAALDGNYVSLDSKHRQPLQIKLPPLFITTNIDVPLEPSLKYLYSRMVCFKFPNEMPMDEHGEPVYMFDDKMWKCFFRKFGNQLDLKASEEEGDGGVDQAFRCTARSVDETL
uniref:Replication protein E1 n=1 Tax=Human papillomavirus TaxID=10566 RepID=A0A385PIQ4_9PAPI|nr:MAG: E1 protein [Human papillomavirus]